MTNAIDTVELRHLRTFIAVAEELNFHSAAARLHVTQAPVTRTIRQLEEILGTRLLDRSTRKCELTPAGEKLLQTAQRFMRRLSADLGQIGVASPPSVLRLGVCFALDAVRLPELRENLRRRCGVRVHLELRGSHELARMLAFGELDAAIVLLPVAGEGLKVTRVAKAEMMAALPASHELARQRLVAVSDLNAFDRFILPGRRDNPAMFGYLQQALERRGLQSGRYARSREAFEGLAHIAAGFACSLLAETLQGTTGKQVVLRLLRKEDRITVDIGVAAAAAAEEQTVAETASCVRDFLVASFGVQALA
ncbi:LysR family transcriptional regulator [Ramlibacter humi]|uniref:LysR family transcriptional regulator n=1 Tax=Ramlibacter humi TaxID=2530451 RepID=A0A4Z0BMP1_9BURK|nr:LysR family transcriptional regulator [Ramlibacter humi]TFZ00101.1 LysR family transcriptional regulator [Ramlibacter humi]